LGASPVDIWGSAAESPIQAARVAEIGMEGPKLGSRVWSSL
jgi:hypothetical protein